MLGHINDEWQLNKPLLLTVELDEEDYIVSDNVFSVYGTGNTLEDALSDYILSLVDYYKLLMARSWDEENHRLIVTLRQYLNKSNQESS